MDVHDVHDAIAEGVVDGHFDDIYDAIKARKKVLTARNALSFQAGVMVRTKDIRPKYLSGLTCEIIGRSDRGTRWVVKLNESDAANAHKYTVDGTLSVLPQCLELVDHGTISGEFRV